VNGLGSGSYKKLGFDIIRYFSYNIRRTIFLIAETINIVEISVPMHATTCF
jgi:hypothetical protein